MKVSSKKPGKWTLTRFMGTKLKSIRKGDMFVIRMYHILRAVLLYIRKAIHVSQLPVYPSGKVIARKALRVPKMIIINLLFRGNWGVEIHDHLGTLKVRIGKLKCSRMITRNASIKGWKSKSKWPRLRPIKKR